MRLNGFPSAKDVHTKTGLDEGIKAGMEDHDTEIRETTERVLLKFIRSSEFERMIRETCADSAKDIVAEALSKRLPELDSRVHALVDARFESAVEATTRDILDGAIASVKAKVAGRQ